MKIDLAISPCPNDTFIFYHLTRTDIGGHPISAIFADIEELNRRAIEEQRHIITKLSFPAILHSQEHYELLSCGGALGRDCGPVLISYDNIKLEEALPKMIRIAVPGHWTTAKTLLQLFLETQPQKPDQPVEYVSLRYDEIIPALHSGDIEFGMIIHEERFTFAEQGLYTIQDLGAWWQESTHLPIPLGGIVIRRDLSRKLRAAVEQGIRASLRAARQNPSSVWPFIKRHAQALNDEVIQAHINLYVNDFTMNMGAEGREAITELSLRMGKEWIENKTLS